MRVAGGILVVIGLGAVAFGAAAFMHPEGMGGFLKDLGVTGRERPTTTTQRTDSTPTTSAPDPVAERKRYDDLMRQGHGAYDKARFGPASTNYLLATAAAPDSSARKAAERGLHRALLARYLVEDARDTVEGDARAAYRELATAAEDSPTEARWMRAARMAASYGFAPETVHAVEQALMAARRGGVVSTRLTAALTTAGSMREHLLTALRGRGLYGSLATGAGTSEDDEPSGIGGVGNARLPFGSFDAEMRKQLKHAVQLQEAGEFEFELAAPDKDHRERHRRLALGSLQEARDIYSAALDMDPQSKDVEERLGQVTRMIAALRKDSIGR